VVQSYTHITNPKWQTAAILEKSKNRHNLCEQRVDRDRHEIWQVTQVEPLEPVDR